jgi:hypothetical protein
MAEGEMRGRRWQKRVVFMAFLALAAVLVALAAGLSPHRLRPVAGFLALGAAAGTAFLAGARAMRRRVFRLSRAPVQRNVRLVKPWWFAVGAADIAIHYVALFGAIVAGFGFPGVGVGVLLVVAAVTCFPFAFDLGQPRGLTFEGAGLRLHYPGMDLLLPWSAIHGIDTIGPPGFDSVQFQVSEPEGVVEWVSPDTPRNRSRAQKMFGPSATFFWFPWTAGLDGQTLARGIREGIAGHPEQMN